MANSTLPSGPTAPAWEQAKLWIETPLTFWRDCQAAYGDTFTVQLGSLGPTVLFCDPAAIQEVFALDRDQYTCSEYNEHYARLMGPQSLLVLDGDQHWSQRRGLAPSFAAAKSSDWINRLRRLLADSPPPIEPGMTWQPRPWVQAMVLENMLQLLFADPQAELPSLLRNVLLKEVSKDYGTWSPWARFSKWHPVFRLRIGQEVARRRAAAAVTPSESASSVTLFERLVAAQPAGEAPLPANQIEDHLFTLVLAGVDPTMISTLWGLHWLYNTPEWIAVLREEQRSFGDLNTWIQDSANWEATLREILRMIPVVTTPTGRKLRQATSIQGRTYPAGTTLVPCTYLVHRREDLYPQADQFRPQRFLERTFKSYEYFPFGGGQRICIGARLAQVTLKTILAELLVRYDLNPCGAAPVTVVRHGTLLAPSDDLCFQVQTAVPAAGLPC